jgi:hypothetical protein
MNFVGQRVLDDAASVSPEVALRSTTSLQLSTAN